MNTPRDRTSLLYRSSDCFYAGLMHLAECLHQNGSHVKEICGLGTLRVSQFITSSLITCKFFFFNRFKHMHIRSNAESIAFYGSYILEKRKTNSRLKVNCISTNLVCTSCLLLHVTLNVNYVLYWFDYQYCILVSSAVSCLEFPL